MTLEEFIAKDRQRFGWNSFVGLVTGASAYSLVGYVSGHWLKIGQTSDVLSSARASGIGRAMVAIGDRVAPVNWVSQHVSLPECGLAILVITLAMALWFNRTRKLLVISLLTAVFLAGAGFGLVVFREPVLNVFSLIVLVLDFIGFLSMIGGIGQVNREFNKARDKG